jgi:hypothetical protein
VPLVEQLARNRRAAATKEVPEEEVRYFTGNTTYHRAQDSAS